MRDRTRMYLHLFITILIMIFIFQRSALSADLSSLESGKLAALIAQLLPLDPGVAEVVVRKTAHFAEFAVLGASLAVNMRDIARMRGIDAALSFSTTSFAVPWIAGTFYAVTDEVHQMFVPGRSCELRDMVIDACGVAVGVLVMEMVSRRRRMKKIVVLP